MVTRESVNLSGYRETSLHIGAEGSMIAIAWFIVSMGISFESFNVDHITGINERLSLFQRSREKAPYHP
ncbi:hypothetical protein [Sphaerochaeta sp. S2]|uniref:hypothetical protein n=1 Tax=Sphaerochaeta sp. S2 TaxID=2798868 RepID=UPI00351C65EC